jgi:predicted permease
MEKLWQDLRYGIRMTFKNPGFTAVAVLVLALGIGANTAMFTLVNVFLLRPLTADNPEELVGCYSKNTKNPGYRAFSYPNYVDLRERNTVFSELMAHDVTMVGLTEGETTRRVFADLVSSNYFATFGVRPFRGRDFTAAEEKPGSAPAVVIVTYEFWKKTGQDPALVGKSVRINGRLFTVIGITPEEFTGTTVMFGPELYLPLGTYDMVINSSLRDGGKLLSDRNNHALILVGRLKPGLTAVQAGSELAVIAAQMEKGWPVENKDQIFTVHPLPRTSISTNPQDNSELTTISILLTSMASVVLLISCLNLANMLLARGAARRKEFAIRLALGGGRGRIMRQLLTEGFVLSTIGGAAALLLSYWAIRFLVSSMKAYMPLEIVFHSGPDPRVLVALMGLCVLSTLIFGLGPALKLSRPDVVADLKEHAGEDAAGVRHSFFSRRNLLVIGQISLSLTLLVAAGLFIKGAFKAGQAEPGFSLDNGVIIELDPGLAGYDEARGREVYATLLDRLGALPGVESFSMAATVPFGMVSLGREVHRAEDSPDDKGTSAQYNAIGADYFKTLGLGILRGRPFTLGEAASGSAPRVAIIDELLAQRLWPDQDPLGKQIHFGSGPGEQPVSMQVVGIVPGVRDSLFREAPRPHVYLPFGQSYQSNMNVHVKLAVRGNEAETAMLNSLRREIRAVDERLPVLALKTARGHVEENLELWLVRTGARMFTTFGALALFLAVVGVYAVKAYTVSRRTREIGIRIALGATMGDALWLIMRDGLRLTAAGVAVGMVLALATGRLLSSMLYEVGATDPLIFAVTPLLLGAAAALACYLPARRAARVDPMVALRHE